MVVILGRVVRGWVLVWVLVWVLLWEMVWVVCLHRRVVDHKDVDHLVPDTFLQCRVLELGGGPLGEEQELDTGGKRPPPPYPYPYPYPHPNPYPYRRRGGRRRRWRQPWDNV